MKWKYILISLVFLLFFWGGLGENIFAVNASTLMILLFLWMLWKLLGREILIPNWFMYYGLFLILLAMSNWWSMDMQASLKMWVHFAAAGVWGIVGYSLGSKKSKNSFGRIFPVVLIVLGLAYGLVNVLSRVGVLNRFLYTSHGLVGWYVHSKNHAHIGDFWALILIGIFVLWSKKRKLWHYLVFGVGLYFVYLSQSRSALLSIVVGVGYLMTKQKKVVMKNYVWLFSLIVLLFVIFGATKRTLLNRQYWVQGVVGVIRNPLGVGVGNFWTLSENEGNHLFGLSAFSRNAHNLLLEIVGGMGVLGLYFVWWFVKNIWELWQKDMVKNKMLMAVFWALTANFMTDSTYLVPSMLWLWFLLFGYVYGSVD